MVALGSCVDKAARLENFKHLMARLIRTTRVGENLISFSDKAHQREIIEMARGARRHYLGCFPNYKGAEGFGRANNPAVPVPLTRLGKELLGPDTTMLPRWSPVFSDSENFWENVNRQVYGNIYRHRTSTRKSSSGHRRRTTKSRR